MSDQPQQLALFTLPAAAAPPRPPKHARRQRYTFKPFCLAVRTVAVLLEAERRVQRAEDGDPRDELEMLMERILINVDGSGPGALPQVIPFA